MNEMQKKMSADLASARHHMTSFMANPENAARLEKYMETEARSVIGQRVVQTRILKNHLEQFAKLVKEEKVSLEQASWYEKMLLGTIGLFIKLFKSAKEKGKLRESVYFARAAAEEKMQQQKLVQPEQASQIKCRKGCSFCCHQRIGVSKTEASLLADEVRKGLKIDLDKVRLRSSWSLNEWIKNPKDSKCVFLGDEGECRVYNERPLVCRTYHVVSDPALCDGDQKIQMYVFAEAEAITTALLTVDEGGSIDEMLSKELL